MEKKVYGNKDTELPPNSTHNEQMIISPRSHPKLATNTRFYSTLLSIEVYSSHFIMGSINYTAQNIFEA